MKSFTLSFWPGLFLAITLRLGLGLTIFIGSMLFGSGFYDGVAAGLGLSWALRGAVKLWKELRD